MTGAPPKTSGITKIGLPPKLKHMMIPSAPMSVACWIELSCSSAIRTIGIAPACGHAAIIFSMSAQIIVLCCISNQMKS